jgi:hypothetical protein
MVKLIAAAVYMGRSSTYYRAKGDGADVYSVGAGAKHAAGQVRQLRIGEAVLALVLEQIGDEAWLYFAFCLR